MIDIFIKSMSGDLFELSIDPFIKPDELVTLLYQHYPIVFPLSKTKLITKKEYKDEDIINAFVSIEPTEMLKKSVYYNYKIYVTVDLKILKCANISVEDDIKKNFKEEIIEFLLENTTIPIMCVYNIKTQKYDLFAMIIGDENISNESENLRDVLSRKMSFTKYSTIHTRDLYLNFCLYPDVIERLEGLIQSEIDRFRLFM